MVKLSRKINYGIRNPTKGIRYLFGGKQGKKDAIYSVVRDYSKDKTTLTKLSSFLEEDLSKYHKELLSNELYKKAELDIAENSVAENTEHLWLFGFTEARLLYTLCRFFKPKIVIETGVASGLSSFMFLLAMKMNNIGHLYSIDLPLGDKRSYPPGKTIGWLVPDSLKDFWTLKIGDSKKLLPEILKETKSCDVFLHDSLHTYDHMLWEYQTVWPYLKKALLSDDTHLHDVFGDFVSKNQCKSHKISKRVGLILR